MTLNNMINTPEPFAVAAGGTGVNAVTITPTASAFSGWDANKNLSANSFIQGYRTTATAAGTTTLVVGDTEQQYFTGSTTQTVLMPVTSTLVLGQQYQIVNLSSGVVTVQSSGANSIQAMAASTVLTLTCILTSGTTAASWSAVYSPLSAGGSSPWSAGSGTNSALGGDGTTLAAGAQSLAYGLGATQTTAQGTGSIAVGNNVNVKSAGCASFGRNNTIGLSCPYSFIAGDGNSTSAFSGSYIYIFGQNNVCTNGQPAFVFGTGCTVKGNYGFAIGNTAVCNNNGSVVWGDYIASPVPDSNPAEMRLTFAGGFYLYNTNTPNLLASFLPAGAAIRGTNTNDSAAAGFIGEEKQSIILEASGVSLTNNTNANITSLSLTAGDWDVWANTNSDVSIGCTAMNSWISSTSATQPDFAYIGTLGAATATLAGGPAVPQQRFSLSTTTTVYLSANYSFATGTVKAYGGLYARRVR